MKERRYILASSSPRRKELLARCGFPFEVIPSTVEEVINETKPCDIVMELSRQKARDVHNRHAGFRDVVIGADTIVVYKDEILGKPKDEADALDMLSLLSDRTHQVYTGVTIIWEDKINTFYECTDVTFYPIDRQDIIRYIESKDPLDKAGAYGIQGDFAIHVKKVVGEYANVVGLPVGRVYQELKKIL